jgi:hypothetical protein
VISHPIGSNSRQLLTRLLAAPSFAASLFLALLLACVACASARAAPAPEPHIGREIGAARLAGQGTFRWFGIAVYEAQLWVGPRGYLASAPEAAPFVLDLHYARALEGEKIAEASFDQLEKIKAGTSEQRAAWLLKMRAIFPDVKQGSRLSGVYLPGSGARFYLDGKMLGEVQDAAFGRAFFSIWLAPASTAGSLRLALLQDAAPLP